jgi:hypothetical protein
LQGFNFLGREISIEFAKARSKSIVDYEEWKGGMESQEAEGEPEPELVQEKPVLLVTGYPPNANAIVLQILFRQMPGFQRVETNGETALVYYEEPQNATDALTKLQGFSVTPTCKLAIQYAP